MLKPNAFQGVDRGIAKIRANFQSALPSAVEYSLVEKLNMAIARSLPTVCLVALAAFFVFMQRYCSTLIYCALSLVLSLVSYRAPTFARCVALAGVALCVFVIPIDGLPDTSVTYPFAIAGLAATAVLGVGIGYFTRYALVKKVEQDKLADLKSEFDDDPDVPIFAIMQKHAPDSLFPEQKDEYAELQPAARLPFVLTFLVLAVALAIADPHVSGKTSKGFQDQADCAPSVNDADSPTTYEPYGDGVKLTRWHAEASDVVVPSEFEGKKVVAIGQAFLGDASIVSVALPDTVEEIEPYAFAGCGSLVELKLPARLASLPEGLCLNCAGLTNVAIPENVAEIQPRCFYGCLALKDVVLPQNLVSIGAYAFAYCQAIDKIDLPDSLTELRAYAFANSGLQAVSIPQSIATLKEGCFYSCQSLVSVDLPQNLKKISEYVFFECTALESIAFPPEIEKIGPYAFSESGLKTVTIPGSIKAVRERCFAQCPNLTDVTIEPGVTRVGARAFFACHKLENVTAPWTMKIFASSCFRECESLKKCSRPFYVVKDKRAFKDSSAD